MELTRRSLLIGSAALGFAAIACGRADAAENFAFKLTDAQWRKRLSPAAYRTLRHEDTERPGSSQLNKEKRKGVYACAGCALPVFASTTKFESGTGWPSFWQPLRGAVGTKIDGALGNSRVEVRCRRCGGHLGHVFDDGPKPTGKRYCMNGVAMTFKAT